MGASVVRLELPPESPPPDNLIDILAGAAGSSFAQSIALLLLTALVTGLLVPRVKARMDVRHFAEQKDHEAKLTRQAEIIKEQVSLLKQFSDIAWKYHMTVLQVTYAKASGYRKEDFEAIWETYEATTWECVRDLRRTISHMSYLLSSDFYATLLKFNNMLVGNDELVTVLVESGGRDDTDWGTEPGRLYNEVSGEIDATIRRLAGEFRLAPLAQPSVLVKAG